MTDKPDALEELRALSETNDVEGTFDFAPAAIAAWEKERMDVRAEREAHAFLLEHRRELRDELVALTTAVEKRVEKMRDDADKCAQHPGYQATLQHHADALDAALRGGA